jgi:hypothetical protein
MVRQGGEAGPENHQAMTETEQELRDRHMIVAKDGLLRFIPPPGSAYSEDELARIVAYMCRENTKRMMNKNHPNQPTK